jgi:hypothetical protein
MAIVIYYDTWSVDANVAFEDDEDTTWAAMDPRAHCALLRRGIDPQRIHTEVGWIKQDHREKLVQGSAVAMDWLRGKVNFHDLGPLNTSARELVLWYSYWCINFCLWNIELVQIFIEAFDPETIQTHQPHTISHADRFVGRQDGFRAEIAGAVAQNHGKRFLPLSEPETRVGLADRIRYRKSWVAQKLKGIRSRKTAASADGLGSVIATTPHYRMGTVIELLHDRGMKSAAFLLDGDRDHPFKDSFNLSALAEVTSRDPELEKELQFHIDHLADEVDRAPKDFTHLDVEFGSLLSRKLRCGIASFLKSCCHRAKIIRNILKTARPRIVLSAGDQDDDRFTGAICRELNIPGLMISHGSHVAPGNEADRIEWGEHTVGKLNSSFSYAALQSPLAEAHLRVFPSDSDPVVTGPLLWGSRVNRKKADALRAQMLGDSTSRVIMHAGTPKGGRSTRFFVYETHNEYVQGIVDLAEAVQRLENVHLIVKFRPSNVISVEDLKSLVAFSDKVILSVDEGFLDVLGFSDLMVSFSSTTIEEALLNEVPVLFYGGEGRYIHLEAEEYNRGDRLPVSPVYAVRSRADLGEGLKEILNRTPELKSEAFAPYCYGSTQIEPIEDFVQKLSGEKVPLQTQERV